MTTLLVRLPFTATHQIRIAGELEPVHGHDFGCAAEVQTDDDRDAGTLLPALTAALEPLQHTHLDRVEAAEGGYPSAERIARYLYRALTTELASVPATRVRSVTVFEAPGCSATFRDELSPRRS